MEITIDAGLRQLLPNLRLGVLVAEGLSITKKNNELWSEVEELCQKIMKTTSIESITSIREISDARDAYKKIGLDPTKDRPSAEALLRRILRGQGIYQINSVVDVNNYCSVESWFPIGTYDMKAIKGSVILRLGKEDESYQGIAKEIIKLGHALILVDGIGPFGGPTSDSKRTMITTATKSVLMVIFSFSENYDNALSNVLERASTLLTKYNGGKITDKRTIG